MSDSSQGQKINIVNTREPAGTRVYALSPTIITADTEAGANIIGIGRDRQALLISSGIISNVTNQEHRITILIVPKGGVVGDNYAILKNYSVPAYDVANFQDMLMLNPGDTAYAYASVPNAFRLSGWITAYL